MTPPRPLTGQRALTPRANSGRGQSVARALVAAGADVIADDVHGQTRVVDGGATRSELAHGG
jgi:NAD(P)-dependent dehydrogenase (short-subunit alcohol dehydrogenase family)